MKILPQISLTPIHTTTNSKTGHQQVLFKSSLQKGSNWGYPSNYNFYVLINSNKNHNANLVTFSGISYSELKSKYPQDHEYRNELRDGINALHPDLNCQVEDLEAIAGSQEVMDALRNFKAENFSVGGAELKNIDSGIFRANLHLHTNDSDGKSTISNMLDRAAEYANAINQPVYMNITNHDTINDLKKAIKIIAEDKQKFRNLRVVMGIEFNAKYENSKLFNKPLQLEMIGYGINPFDNDFNAFLNETKNKNQAYAREIIEKVNSKYGTEIEFKDIKDYDSSLRNGGSPNFMRKLRECLTKKIESTGQSIDYIDELFKEHQLKYGDIKLTGATRSVKEIIDIVKSTSGFVGIAHPVRNVIGRKINQPSHFEREEKYADYLYSFLKEFKDLGGTAIEAHYQYKPRHMLHPNKMIKLELVHKYSEELGLLKSGGLDNHDQTFFARSDG